METLKIEEVEKIIRMAILTAEEHEAEETAKAIKDIDTCCVAEEVFYEKGFGHGYNAAIENIAGVLQGSLENEK